MNFTNFTIYGCLMFAMKIFRFCVFFFWFRRRFIHSIQKSTSFLTFQKDIFNLCCIQFNKMDNRVKTRSQVLHEQRHDKFIMVYSMYNGYCDCILCIGGFVCKGTTKICFSTKRKLFSWVLSTNYALEY